MFGLSKSFSRHVPARSGREICHSQKTEATPMGAPLAPLVTRNSCKMTPAFQFLFADLDGRTHPSWKTHYIQITAFWMHHSRSLQTPRARRLRRRCMAGRARRLFHPRRGKTCSQAAEISISSDNNTVLVFEGS